MIEKSKASETEIAAATVAWLRDMKWDVYQEVSLGVSDQTIDIVAARGKIVWAVECKVAFTLAVLEQAWRHVRHAHMVSVAVAMESTCSGVKRAILQNLGIGLFQVRYRESSNGWTADRTIDPEFRRQVDEVHTYPALCRVRQLRPKDQRKSLVYPMLRELLHEDQKRYADAGNNRSQRWSPWKLTCQLVREYVVAHPGCVPRDCLEAVRHHYASEASARCNMVGNVKQGMVPGVEQRKDGRIAWWPKED